MLNRSHGRPSSKLFSTVWLEKVFRCIKQRCKEHNYAHHPIEFDLPYFHKVDGHESIETHFVTGDLICVTFQLRTIGGELEYIIQKEWEKLGKILTFSRGLLYLTTIKLFWSSRLTIGKFFTQLFASTIRILKIVWNLM